MMDEKEYTAMLSTIYVQFAAWKDGEKTSDEALQSIGNWVGDYFLFARR